VAIYDDCGPSGDRHGYGPEDQLQEQQRGFLFFLDARKRSGGTGQLDRLPIVAGGRSTPDIVFVARSHPEYGGDGYARFLSETIAILLASVLGSIVVVLVFVYPSRKQHN